MNILCKFVGPCRLGVSLPKPFAFTQTAQLPKTVPCLCSSQHFVYKFDCTTIRNMAQKSITSFFKSTPKLAGDTKEKTQKDETTSPTNVSPPATDGKRESKKKVQRLSSTDDESKSPKPSKRKSSPVSSEKKKKSKRQRIESSESETEPTETKPDIEIKKPSIAKTYESPKTKKTKVKVEKDTSPEKKSPKEWLKIKSPVKEVSPKGSKAKVVTMSGLVKKENGTNEEETKSPVKESSPKGSKKESKLVTKSGIVKKENGTSETETKSPVKESSPKRNKKETKLVSMSGFVKKENGTSEAETHIKKEGGKVSEEEYNPAKPKYHPIDDACWLKGEEVPYLALARTLEAIEAISARLKIVEILSNYFRSVIALTPEDLLPSVYMCLNKLAPAYHSLELGIAETYIMKAIGQCTGRTLAQVKSAAQKTGDLGLVAEQARSTQRTMFTPPPLKARRVFSVLKEVAHMTGHASVNKKIAKIQSLYIACRHSEARYLIRSLEGKLRIGLAEQSVLQALAVATALTPPGPAGVETLDASKGLSAEQLKEKIDKQSLLIKTTYCECPNYEMMIPAMLEHGVSSLPQHCRLTPGIPLKPMLAHPTKGLHEVFNRFENQEFTCEWKYDGERAQIHVPGVMFPDYVYSAIFSRNQENNTTKYPDVLRRLPKLLKEDVTSCVLDTEAVAYDVERKQILPFQILSTRKRKDATESDIKVQVCVFVFDLLYLNGRALVKEPLAERRALLKKHFNEVEGEWQLATSKDCTSMEEVQQFLDESIKGSCEGLMVKMLKGDNSRYDIARRSHNWLKLKKDYLDGVGDTIDAVVIGAYAGKGKRAGVYGGFLLACVDSSGEEYQALCKLGTGFSDEDLKTLTEQLKAHAVDAPKNYYRYDNSHAPDVWFSPSSVWEVRCADLSLSPSHRAAIGLVDPDKGISLRFPRFIRVRDDKTPEQATSAQQIAEMYLAQDQVKNTAAKVTNYDDFY